ncbi:MAG: LamG-like jellyroll fold domain-containing protein, partial [Armatimonadota bacterium]
MRTIFGVVALTFVASAVVAQTPIDRYATFVASFDNAVQPDYAAGDWRAAVSGEAELVEGRFGKALHIPDGRSVEFSADQKINLEAGTVEFWLLWTEELATAESSVSIFGMVTPEAGNYVNFNKISPTRLGMPVKQGPPGEGEWTWQRVDVDPTDWETPSWHHFAGVWEGGITALYVDGELTETAEGGAGFVEQPETFSFGRGPLTIDEVRISSMARTPEEIAAVANAEPGEETSIYLTDLAPASMEQQMGEVGIDSYLAIDEREMPLVIGRTAYARGVAIRAPGSVEFVVPEGMTALRGVYGASPFGREGANVDLTFSADGTGLQECTGLSADGEATPLTLAVQPGQTLRIEASPAGDAPGGVAVLSDAMLLGEGVEPPPSFSRELSADELTLQQMRTRVAEFSFELPDAPKGYVIYADHPVDEVDPAVEPLHESFPAALEIAAAPGEYEAAEFGVFAARDLSGINVTVTDLSGDAGTIGGDDVKVQLIRRVLMRKGYWMPRLPSNYETVSRFIFPNREFWLPESNFKEIYVLAHVPEDAVPGDYAGTLTVSADGADPTEMALNLTVRPVDLIQPTDRRYGMYYRANTLLDRPDEVNDAEFADMAAHGCTMIKGHTAINWFENEDGTIGWDFDLIRTTLEQGLEHGFFGEITIYDSLMRLAALMDLRGLDEEGEGDPVSENEEFLAIAERAFAELAELQAEYPQYEFLLTHMDEVFGRGRLPRYLDYAEVVRKTSDFRLYITLSYTRGASR